MRVRDHSCGGSVWLFIPWGPGFLCKCKGTFTALSLMSLPVWHLSIIIDGHASSDRSPGPMLVWVHLGDVCIVLGSSLVFLVFLYVDRKKRFIIFVLSQQVAHLNKDVCLSHAWKSVKFSAGCHTALSSNLEEGLQPSPAGNMIED